MMKGKGVFMVRAVVADEADRAGFDTWYEKEHLPDALGVFGASRAWRSWSRTDPSVHIAFYEFETVARIEAFQGTQGLEDLIAEFDRHWAGKVTRSREILDVVGETAPAG